MTEHDYDSIRRRNTPKESVEDDDKLKPVEIWFWIFSFINGALFLLMLLVPKWGYWFWQAAVFCIIPTSLILVMICGFGANQDDEYKSIYRWTIVLVGLFWLVIVVGGWVMASLTD